LSGESRNGREIATTADSDDAINLYEQMAALTTNENIRKILLDIAKEEKTHVGEFQALLLKEDKEQEKELEEGRKEVKEILK
jgi:rubrerythrin